MSFAKKYEEVAIMKKSGIFDGCFRPDQRITSFGVITVVSSRLVVNAMSTFHLSQGLNKLIVFHV